MIRLSRKNRQRHKEDSEPERILPEIPSELKWVIMLLVAMILPQKSNWFTFSSSAEEAYAELRLQLPGKTVVIGKNVGTHRIAVLAKSFETHICRVIGGKEAFLAHLPGTIPPASYSVVIFSSPTIEKPLSKVRLDDDSEFEPQQLRVTTPLEENQYIFAVMIVILLAAALAIRLRDYYREDNAAMKGRRS
jgi:hypothetical protein